GPAIADRREEFVQEVPVGRVDLDHLESSGQRATRGGLEGGDDFIDPGGVQGGGRWIVFTERYGTRRDDGPSTLLRSESAATLPWDIAARLAARVRELNGRHGTVAVNEPGDARQR